jgi:uncharacterized protein
MNIIIISDIHDNLVNLEKCLTWTEKQNIDAMFCCGDVTKIETLDLIARKFKQPIYLVRGNMEIYDQDEMDNETKFRLNIKYLGRNAIIELDKKKIGLCHEPFLIGDVFKLGQPDIIFYGHTHKPWIEEKNEVKTVNPGTLSGTFQKATFAVWDTEKDEPELIILEQI